MSPESRATTRIGEIALPFNQVTIAAPDEAVTSESVEADGVPVTETRALVVDGEAVVGIVTATDRTRLVDVAPARQTDRRFIRTLTSSRQHDQRQRSYDQTRIGATVIVGIDGSQAAIHAAEWAADEAAVGEVPLSCWPSSNHPSLRGGLPTAISNTLRPPCGRREP